MPHRDFDDPYTGGLAYIDAAIFKLFGINLLWLRLFLFACFLAWVPAVYALASEFLTPWPAAGVTLVAVAWSVPFLSGLRNPTPVLFDSLEQPQEYERRIRAVIDRDDFINVAVVGESPNFSVEQVKLLRELLPPKFPNSRSIGWFIVYWRH